MTPTLENELKRLQQMPNGTLKRVKSIKGHSADAPYCSPIASGARIMTLDKVEVSVLLEDPFHDPGQYASRMPMAEFPEWQRQPLPAYVLSEHERLGVKLPANYSERTTGLLRRYEEMLTAARDAITAELQRIRRMDGGELL